MTVQTDVKTDVKVEDKVADLKVNAQAETKQIIPTSQPTTADAQKPPEETQEQINWRKFRQERDRERKEKAETERKFAEEQKQTAALKAAVEALVNKPANQQQSYQDAPEETEDQRVKRLVFEAMQEKEKEYAVERQKREAAELPQKLASTFSDFNNICSQENMDYLEYHYPEVWAGFKHSTGNFDVWAGLYKTIKRLVPNTDSRKEQAKIEKNLAKPQSMSSPGMAATGDHAPQELTEQRKKDNWARIRATMKSI